MSVTAPNDGYSARSKIVVDHCGGLHFVRHDSEPGVGGYPDGWMELDGLLDAIEDDGVKLLIEGILQSQIDLREKLRKVMND